MPTRNIHEKAFDSATLTKLEIFRSYTEAWLPTFINNPRCTGVNICDFFAGEGCDCNGKPGSPLIIIDVLKKFLAQIRKKNLKMNLLFNDDNRKKFKSLDCHLNEEIGVLSDINDLIKYECLNEDFEVLFDDRKAELKNECNLLFFDQNGIKHITERRIKELDRFSKTDYLFFSSSSYLKRFEYAEYHPKFRVSYDISHTDIHRAVLEYYKSLLPCDSETKLYPFTLVKENSRSAVYGLIFGTKHILGADKFLRIAWGENPINGEANFDIDGDMPDPQLKFDFEDTSLSKVDSFKLKVRNLINSAKSITNKELYHYAIREGFIPKFAAEAVREMRDSGELEHFSYPMINYGKVVKDNQIVHFKVKGS